MTPEERDKHILDLFIHPGWKVLTQEMREAYDQLVASAHTVVDERALYKRKGEIQKLAEFLAFEEVTKLQMTENQMSGNEDI